MANRATALFAQAAAQGDKVALIFEEERYTYRQLAEAVKRTAGGLAALGVVRGTHVGIMIPSTPSFIIVQQALFALGAVVTPLNILYRRNEVAHAIASCNLAHVVVTPALAECVPADVASMRSIIVVDGEASGAIVLPDAAPLDALAEVGADNIAMLLLTSATTGKSKGVMLTAANLAANYDRAPGWLGISGDDVILGVLPLYNTFGLNQCINGTLLTGATLVLLPRFDVAATIAAIARHRCTFLPAVPTMLRKIVDDPAARDGALASLRRVMTGGAPVPAALLARVLAATGGDTVVLTGYGLTESTALVTLAEVRLGADGEVEHGRTIGRVLDGMDLAIMDDAGALLPVASVGEIVIRGPNIMRGYYRAPEDTAAALAHGWLHSGDLGYLDRDGYAFIVDRKKDIIIRGGQNIYPADIEEVLYGVAGVAEVAVVGVADDALGEVPVAYVALQGDRVVTEQELLDRCARDLARYKHPVVIHFRDELPKGPTGKILRRALRSAVTPTA